MLLESPGAGAAAAPTRLPAHPSPRILMVEADVAIRQLNALVLIRLGYRVDGADDGIAGWETLQENRFDLLITNLNLPRLSGLELLKKVRSARMALPVILAASAWPEPEQERHPRLEFAAAPLKPFSFQQLLEAVKKVLSTTDRCARIAPEGCLPVFTTTFRQRLQLQRRDNESSQRHLQFEPPINADWIERFFYGISRGSTDRVNTP